MNDKNNDVKPPSDGFDEKGEAIAWPQLVVNGVHKHASQKEVISYATKLGLVYRKIKKVPGKEFCFISFDTLEQLEVAKKLLNGTYFRNSRIEAITRTNHTAVRDERVGRNKRSAEGDDDRFNNTKKPKISHSSARDVVAPWWMVPYPEQLHRKSREMNEVMKKLMQQLRLSYKEKAKGYSPSSRFGDSHRWYNRFQAKPSPPPPPTDDATPTWLKQKKQLALGESLAENNPSQPPAIHPGNVNLNLQEYADSGLLMDPIIASPQLYGYRNKCEFTFGWDQSSPARPAIGFRISGYAEGTNVGAPDDCPTVPNAMKRVVDALTRFIRDSAYRPYDTNRHTGVWRLLTCRYSVRTGDFVVMLCVSEREIAGSSSTVSKPEDVGSDVKMEIGNTVEDNIEIPITEAKGELQSVQTPLTGTDNGGDNGVVTDIDAQSSAPVTADLATESYSDKGSMGSEGRMSQWRKELYRMGVLLSLLPKDPSLADEGEGQYQPMSDAEYSGLMHTVAEQDTAAICDYSTILATEKGLVSGFCVQVYNGLSVPHADHPATLIFGKAEVEEILLSAKFSISPQSFFQVNTPTAELLFKYVIDALNHNLPEADRVGETSQLPQDTSGHNMSSKCVLDVCCGAGTIGLCYAVNDRISRSPSDTTETVTPLVPNTVVGIELCSAAVQDARRNSVLNGLNSSEDTSSAVAPEASTALFVCNRAETVLDCLLGRGYGKGMTSEIESLKKLTNGRDLLAVVDPPREGMHPDCLRAIRNCRRITRLVYVSCNPTKSLLRDAGILCGPASKRLQGTAFRAVRGCPVDLFPMTPHCEFVLVLDRCAEADLPKKTVVSSETSDAGESTIAPDGTNDGGDFVEDEKNIVKQVSDDSYDEVVGSLSDDEKDTVVDDAIILDNLGMKNL